MAGYEEVLTDPSYAGQIVTMTSPHQGNYGLNLADEEWRDPGRGLRGARGVQAGFVVARRVGLRDALAQAGVVGIEGIDTRRLTRTVRERGAMRAAISTLDLDGGPWSSGRGPHGAWTARSSPARWRTCG